VTIDKLWYNNYRYLSVYYNKEVMIMENLMSVASYVFNRYQDTMGEKIDEMKLHKLLYFAQRESIIQKNEPLFAEVFYGWKFGPILKEIRNAYRDNTFFNVVDEDIVARIKKIMDKVFE
jgi:uncharacterized phage-associated protein